MTDDIPQDDATTEGDVATTPEETPSTDEAAAEDQGDRRWYVLKVQSNREKSIRTSLERRIKRDGLEEHFGEIVIPTQKIKETRNGKPRVVEQKLFPGYIMIHMELNDDTWYLVRDTTGVGDFTGAAGKPIPMEDHEVASMLGAKETEDEGKAEPVTKIDFAVGEMVKIKEGGFEGFEGAIDSIDEKNGRITVIVEIFHRSTEVDLEYWQAEKI